MTEQDFDITKVGSQQLLNELLDICERCEHEMELADKIDRPTVRMQIVIQKVLAWRDS